MIRSLSLWLFIFVNIIIWFPNKALPYLLPAGIILVYLLTPLSLKRTFKLILLLLFLVCLPFMYYLPNPDFLFQNYLVAILTYSTVILVLFVPKEFFYELRYDQHYKRIILFFLVIQSVIGIAQGVFAYYRIGSFVGYLGDYLSGTHDLAFTGTTGIETQIFFVGLLFYILYLLPYFNEKHMVKYIILGMFAIILSSVVHMFFFLFLSIGISLLLYYGIKKIMMYRLVRYLTLLFVLILPGLAFVLQPENIGRIPHHLQSFFLFENPKAKMINRFFTEIPESYPMSFWVGLGPGQFSSRASLMVSGRYSGQNLPLVEEQISEPARMYLLDLWMWVQSLPYGGSTFYPYYSWMSWLSEFGIIGSILLICGLLFLLYKTKTLQNKVGNNIRVIAFATGILFLFLIGFQDNYWEIPQIVILGVVISKMMYARLCLEASGGKVKVVKQGRYIKADSKELTA